MKISVRTGPLSLEEAEKLSAIHIAAFEPSGARGWSPQEIIDLLKRPGALLLAAESAFILADIICGEAEVTTIAVNPTKQNQGIGRVLFDAFLSECRLRDVNKCILEVASNNSNAIKLYDSFNFQKIAIRESYFRLNNEFFSAFLMEKSLVNN